MQFYTNKTIVQDFKNYIEHLITHKNPYTGLTYGEDPTIFAYETGNELGGPIFGELEVVIARTRLADSNVSGDQDVPVTWTTEIAVSLYHEVLES